VTGGNNVTVSGDQFAKVSEQKVRVLLVAPLANH
jgi:hypothetical protein